MPLELFDARAKTSISAVIWYSGRMNNQVLKEILNLIDVEPIEENLFRGQNHDTEHVFGGQVLAQAVLRNRYEAREFR